MRLVLTLTALLTLWAAPALACSCPDSAFTPEASRANIAAAHYIFSGRVLGVEKGAEAAPEAEDASRPRENPAYSRMTVSIKKRFKGPSDARNLVIYADTGTSCGAPPEELVKTELFMVLEEQGDYVLAPACAYFLTPEDQAALRRGDFKNMKTVKPPQDAAPQTPPAVPVEEVKVEPIPAAPQKEETAQPEPEPAPAPEQSETASYPAPAEAAPPPEPVAEETPTAEPPATPEAAEAPPTAQAPPAGTSLSLFKNGAPFELPAPLAAELTAGFSKTARACWLYQGERTEDDWAAAIAEGSYISLRYENAAGTVELAGMPGKAFGAHIWIEEAIFPAPKGGKAIDSPLVRSSGVVHMLGKCDTLYLASIQCRPELADFFGETYRRSCDIVEKWNAKKGE
ncbi:MAG: hypothetical protein KJ017_09070 [Alphaproteobacteria bacterium]|nr:hypothetical protein [Alphaproteobacteria bacterium]